jgi:ArpU family phage transcriptional regulator
MDEKLVINWIIDELRHYKTYEAILMELLKEHSTGEDYQPQATVIKDIPTSITNKFHSKTESLALYNNEIRSIDKAIERIRAWLHILDEDEKIIITKKYIQNIPTKKIIDNWHNEICENSWHIIRRSALRCIYNWVEFSSFSMLQ